MKTVWTTDGRRRGLAPDEWQTMPRDGEGEIFVMWEGSSGWTYAQPEDLTETPPDREVTVRVNGRLASFLEGDVLFNSAELRELVDLVREGLAR